MEEFWPSTITLAGFFLPAMILIIRAPDRHPSTLGYLLIIAGLCLLGGLMFSAALMYWYPPFSQPLLSSLLVVLGALLSLGLRRLWSSWSKPD
ncbi:hypothetical protein [Marinobacterium marinum]|uniref:Uncharacterized protein n=1 Tax=Marinobacterium marinum TaxID=2756129 RepID=A0A7W2ACR7_9GAMM|nr:hypothetical protein [Marinobacterium marinum]MBA4502393.1 hypothetical protein [Marinobacterium marinum]